MKNSDNDVRKPSGNDGWFFDHLPLIVLWFLLAMLFAGSVGACISTGGH